MSNPPRQLLLCFLSRFGLLYLLAATIYSTTIYAQQIATPATSDIRPQREAAAATVTSTPVTTGGGTTGLVPVFTGASTVGNSIIRANSTSVGIGVAPSSYGVLDVGGPAIFRGSLGLARTGNASPSTGTNSVPLLFGFQYYNSAAKFVYNPYFSLQAEATGNNTANPAGTMSLLYYNGIGGKPAETGFYFNTNGTIHFAPSQTFPIDAGPSGPQGPAGATGPAGSQGPAGALSLPYQGSADGQGYYVFTILNTATDGSGGIYARGAQSSGGSADGGVGVKGLGGGNGSGVGSSGGDGVGGMGSASFTAGTYGGNGGTFRGGQGAGAGGDGVLAIGADSVGGNAAGGNGIDAYAGAGAVYAGAFHGNVDVSGNLSKAGGSFRIDHPLDPENKYLSHSFVESPDMKNIYDGNAITDSSGRATVELPDWFEALNRDFRYQLTTIGRPAKVWIAAKVSNNRFIIQTDEPGVEVSWQVTGIRQDAWAKAHRIPVVEDKAIPDKGKFLHPELFGHPEEDTVMQGSNPRRHR
ncbi:hypothetical protein HDF16_003839 [Granulicella aggregans]|uniref:Uncharacterized protein n=1 Tax=Granulicella aggregans TaxID=474949 RepID=A0A7W8E510_9BACT|nr:collagen-like protein [Granulicella aggregans]MBB5059116.1 hypothetical protein [Granulicella aggregans]